MPPVTNTHFLLCSIEKVANVTDETKQKELIFMKIQRNSKYQQKTSNIDTNKIISYGLGKYKYPVFDKVPSGWYVSRIDAAKYGTTSSGKPCIDVYYKIEHESQCYQRVNGLIKDDYEMEYSYIKQSYPEGTQFYDDFVDAMFESLGNNKFSLSEIIGVTERIGISYRPHSDIGGIDERCPIDEDDYIHIVEDTQDYDEDCDYL